MTNMNFVDDLDFSASEGADVAKSSNAMTDFAREVEFLTLDGSEAGKAQGRDTAFIRLVTEYERKEWMGGNTPHTLPWITVKQHYTETKPRPPYAREGSTWPSKMNATCRADKIFAKKYGTCELCQRGAKTSDRTWALAIEREQVVENGRVVGMVDKTREVLVIGADGKAVIEREEGDKKIYAKKTVPAWVVLNFGWKNFFGPLAGQAQWNHTVLSRDFAVQRTGTGTDTVYTFVGLDQIPMTGEFAQQLGVAEGTPYDLGMTITTVEGRPVSLSEVLYPDMPDLRRIIAERTTDEYYGRWFTPGWVPEGFDASAATSTGAPAPVQAGVQQGYAPPAPAAPATAPAAAGPSSDALAALRQRIGG